MKPSKHIRIKRIKKGFLNIGRCCRCASVKKLSIDHITPQSYGGNNASWNLQVMCYPCNQLKANLPMWSMPEFEREESDVAILLRVRKGVSQ